ncbi:hypothetical protein EUGRSUZ_G01158, partial [Eucalyptus grandis]
MGKQLFLILNFVLLWWWSSITISGSYSQNQTDRLALASFKNAIHEDPFGVLSSWNDSTHHCEWQGVFCSKRHPGRVTSLVLRSQGLEGFLSAHIGNLSFLRVMVLQNNSFRGEIQPQIGNLFRLRNLDLSNNSFGGPIPSNLSHCLNLEILNLIDNQLVGGIHFDLGSLTRLKQLRLSKNSLVGPIPRWIGNLSQLQQLSLAINELSGEIPKELSKLKRLTLFQLRSNKLTGEVPTGILNNSDLYAFGVSHNQLRGSFLNDVGTASPSLYFLGASYNLFTGMIPSTLTNATGLENLILLNNNFHGPIPKNLGSLKGLNVIALGSNQEIASSIGNITSLGHLDLSSNIFQGYIPQSLGNCKQLIELDLSNNDLIGLVPAEIVGLSSLSIALSLANNNLSGSLPLQVGSLKNLGKLDLSYNRLTGLIPASISECLVLERLHLEANSFHGQIPEALRPLRGLQELDLSNNNFFGPIPSFLAELPLLEYLNLSFNQLEGRVLERGVFLNASSVSIYGNTKLCGGVPSLKLPLCKSSSSKKSSSTKARVIYGVAGSLLCLALLLLWRYGTVFKGILDGGAMVAIKVLNLMQRGALRSFISECRTLGTIRHRNLVKILSVCSGVDFRGNDFKALIYEFMANESLEEWLHLGTMGRDDECNESRNLSLVQRLNIAIDIATAIEYLHKGCYPAIVHGDLKPSNVLLDNDMVARVGDFGLAKIISTVCVEATGVQDQGSSTSTAVRGSIGYVPPEYGMGHKVSTLGDAYSYGILLLEMFTGKRPTEEAFGHHLNLHNFVRTALPDRAMDIVDLSLLSEAGDRQQEIKIRDCIFSIFEVGVACSMESPPDRMDMTEAIRKLHLIKASYEAKERRI